MKLLLLILGLVVVGLGIVMKIKFGKRNNKALLLVPVGLLIIALSGSFSIVPTGYVGIRTTFGQISEKSVPQGFNWQLPLAQTIKAVNCKQQEFSVDSEVWGESSEKTPVYASKISISYQLNAESAAWIFRNVSNTDDLISVPMVVSAVKSSMVSLPSDEVTVRSKIEPIIKQELQKSMDERYGANKITILKIVVSQMDFEESYNKAISEKSIAQQAQEKQKIENETAVAKAEADKKVAITNAQAKAESTKIAAQAQAEANEKLKSSLNEQILKSKFYEKWDGKLPSAMDSDTVISSINK